ncbi:hypothetical protein NQ317_005930 [Molorchus minor]|uniref:Uncharacterized protein n=1 Tax=Molorchus minor TaxID=1323400 RepID=A0ABQ9J7S2_9CUCU|nr:hypothetical protein NQ317_005930 [Molorchus minor]
MNDYSGLPKIPLQRKDCLDPSRNSHKMVGIENQETELSRCLKINRNPPRPDEPFSWKTLDIFSGGPFWQ